MTFVRSVYVSRRTHSKVVDSYIYPNPRVLHARGIRSTNPLCRVRSYVEETQLELAHCNIPAVKPVMRGHLTGCLNYILCEPICTLTLKCTCGEGTPVIYTNMDINYFQSITTTEIIHPCILCQ